MANFQIKVLMKSLMSLTDTKNQTDKREIEEVLNHLEDSLVENKVNPSAVSRQLIGKISGWLAHFGWWEINRLS